MTPAGLVCGPALRKFSTGVQAPGPTWQDHHLLLHMQSSVISWRSGEHLHPVALSATDDGEPFPSLQILEQSPLQMYFTANQSKV